MGMLHALEYSGDETLSLEQGISIHLSANHYPPIPQVMVPVCIEAITAYWEDDSERLIPLPFDGERDGKPFQIEWRGQTEAPAWAIAEHAHLWAWIES
jgi:hypothetical protein